MGNVPLASVALTSPTSFSSHVIDGVYQFCCAVVQMHLCALHGVSADMSFLTGVNMSLFCFQSALLLCATHQLIETTFTSLPHGKHMVQTHMGFAAVRQSCIDKGRPSQ